MNIARGSNNTERAKLTVKLAVDGAIGLATCGCARATNDRGCFPGPNPTGTRLGGTFHVLLAARLAQQIPRDAALAARARPAGLVHTGAGVPAAAAAVAAARVLGPHVIRRGDGEHFVAQFAKQGVLVSVVGHQLPEYPLVRGRFHSFFVVAARLRVRAVNVRDARCFTSAVFVAVIIIVIVVVVVAVVIVHGTAIIAAATSDVVVRRFHVSRPFRGRFPYSVRRRDYL